MQPWSTRGSRTLVFNGSCPCPPKEGIWQRYSSTYSSRQEGERWVANFTPCPFKPRKKSRYQLNRTLDRTHSRSARFGGERLENVYSYLHRSSDMSCVTDQEVILDIREGSEHKIPAGLDTYIIFTNLREYKP